MTRDDDRSRALNEALARFAPARHGGEVLSGAPIGKERRHDDPYLQLLLKAREMAAESTDPDAGKLDVEAWLQGWIRKPQPALGGRRPIELLDTPAGLQATLRVLGACLSGAFQ